MERLERTAAPGWLEDNWEKWGREWRAKCLANKKKAKFQWPLRNENKPQELKDKLSQMTKRHCSFCDAYPMGRRIPNTVEHFKPKKTFPMEAFKWENLFICCGLCQEKGSDFDEKLLKPDAEDYSFDKYFDIDWDTGQLLPNPTASDEDQERARITIDLYRLNLHGKPDDRKEEIELYQNFEGTDIHQFSYRFYLRAGS